MDRYSASGPTAQTAAAADNAIAQLWNPSTSKVIYVKEIHIYKVLAGGADIPRIRRTSARGTASTSYTPDITTHADHDLAPVSGVLLDLAFSGQPTFLGTASRGILGGVAPSAIGSGFMWVIEVGLKVKAGQGLAIVTGSVLAYPVSEVVYVWDE